MDIYFLPKNNLYKGRHTVFHVSRYDTNSSKGNSGQYLHFLKIDQLQILKNIYSITINREQVINEYSKIYYKN